ncbi:MAG: hypothetical protein ACI3XH_02010 [Phascolarctobacterium sp.]
MDKAIFTKKAKAICLSSFMAYFIENDMAKSCAHMPADRFKSFCINTLHNQVDYKDFLDYIMPTENFEDSAIVEDLQLQVPFATDELCVVMLTAKVYFIIDNGYKLSVDCCVSYVVVQKQDELEILHLHYSMPQNTVRNIKLRQRDNSLPSYTPPANTYVTKGAATAAGLYSPNGLMFYQISGKKQISFVNNTLLQLLGYASIEEFLAATQGQLQNIVTPSDWPSVQAQLSKEENGHIFNMNISFIRKDGSLIDVLFRGNFIDNHNRYYVLSLTPLMVPEEQLYYGDFSLEKKFTEDYSISYELFLKIALDVFLQYGREKGIPYLLELCCSVLNAQHANISDVRDLQSPIKNIYNYAVAGYKPIMPYNMPSRCVLYYAHKFNTYCYDNIESMPEPVRSFFTAKGIHSWLFQIITINNKESFLLHFLRQEKDKPWTENEKKIMHYACKIFQMVLDTYAKNHTEASSCPGGAQ